MSQMTDYASAVGQWFFNNSGVGRASFAQALQEAQIDEQIDQGVAIGDGRAIAEVGRSMPKATACALIRSTAVSSR